MLKIILRAMAEIVFYTLTMPIKIITLIYLVLKAIVYRGDSLSVSERFYYTFVGIKAGFKTELHWVKTGEITSFYEHIDPEEIELY